MGFLSSAQGQEAVKRNPEEQKELLAFDLEDLKQKNIDFAHRLDELERDNRFLRDQVRALERDVRELRRR